MILSGQHMKLTYLQDKLTELSLHIDEQKAMDDAVEKSKILERYQR